VLRDIVYGMARSAASNYLIAKYPELTKTTGGRFYLAFMVRCGSTRLCNEANHATNL